MIKNLLWLLLLCHVVSTPSFAQNIDDYISIKPAGNWVKPRQAGEEPFELAADDDRIYRLVDQQRKVTATEDEYYFRDVTTLLSRDAVDDNGTITTSFNPAYETVVLHHVRILRASGEVVDVTEQGEMQLYRLETDREQLIYDGRLELAFLVPQLKRGDTLDYALTSIGRNPALGPHWQHSMRHGYRRPTQKLYKRILVGEGTQIFIEPHNGAPEPTVAQLGEFTEYSWDQHNVPGQVREENVPDGFRSLKRTTVGSIESWSEVGTFFAPLYEPTQFQSPQVVAIADDIRSANVGDKKAQLRAALGYVQSEVRYTGVLLGTGGFVPRNPLRILSRGFGDCKDMTVLLTSILFALDIEATPFLVNIDVRGGLTDDRPRIMAFDHVVVRATVDGKSYILDPTRGEQLGDLDHVQQGGFGKGVVIAPDSVGMIDASIRKPKYFDDVVDTFDFTADPKAIMFTSRAIYSGKAADSVYDWMKQDGKAAIEENYLDYFKKLYPSIEIANPLNFEVDKEKASVTITTSYKLTDPWQRDEEAGGRVFWASPDDLLSKLPELTDEKRTSPLALTHPVRFRHQIRFIMDKSWGYERTTVTKRTPAFIVKMVARGEPGTATKTYTYVTKSDRILPEDLQQVRTALKEIDEIEWTRLDVPDSNAFWKTLGLENMSEQDIGTAFSVYIAALILVQLLVVSYKPQQPDQTEMKHQVLYPVTTTKFLIMSLGTMGVYTSYWFWQNWRWLRDMNDQNVSPFWRGFVFPALWNFGLFSRIVTQEPTGRKSIARLAIPLAIAILLLDLFQVADFSDEFLGLTFIAMILAVLAVIPIQREVLRKNEANGKWIARNSRFGWKAITALILWMPVMAMTIVGLVAS